ncbi:hypothetical protein IAU59_006838 [Kwoniella sp. CBS 9459]
MGSTRRLSLFVIAFLSVFSFALARPTTTRIPEPTTTVAETGATGESSWDFDPHGEAETDLDAEYAEWAEMGFYGVETGTETETTEFTYQSDQEETISYGPEPRPDAWVEEGDTAEEEPRLIRRMYGGELERRNQMEMLDNLSNAQRMARGLPLRKPRQLYDHKLGARAPAASDLPK